MKSQKKNTFLCFCESLSVCFPAVNTIFLDPNKIRFKWPYICLLPVYAWIVEICNNMMQLCHPIHLRETRGCIMLFARGHCCSHSSSNTNSTSAKFHYCEVWKKWQNIQLMRIYFVQIHLVRNSDNATYERMHNVLR